MENPSRITMICAAAVLVVAAAPSASRSSLNARFVDWPERTNVIHIIVLDDEGRPSQPAATAKEGQWVLFGFEWAGETVEALQNDIVDNPDHDITLAVDGGTSFSVKDGYQDPFEAEPGSGPRWAWDHDGDGLGDGNGNGVGDWDGPILFFRYQHTGLSVGTHTFEFEINGDFDVITVEVIADE